MVQHRDDVRLRQGDGHHRKGLCVARQFTGEIGTNQTCRGNYLTGRCRGSQDLSHGILSCAQGIVRNRAGGQARELHLCGIEHLTCLCRLCKHEHDRVSGATYQGVQDSGDNQGGRQDAAYQQSAAVAGPDEMFYLHTPIGLATRVRGSLEPRHTCFGDHGRDRNVMCLVGYMAHKFAGIDHSDGWK